jgi:hypothetical protein
MRFMRLFIFITLVSVVSASIFLSGCITSKEGAKAPANITSSNAPSSNTPIHFAEVSHEVGIDFQHFNGGRGRKLMPETVG